MSIADVRIVVVADYVSNLDLFYVYGKAVDLNVMRWARARHTDFSCTVRVELHVNDLNFLIPEVIVDKTQLAITGSSGRDTVVSQQQQQQQQATATQHRRRRQESSSSANDDDNDNISEPVVSGELETAAGGDDVERTDDGDSDDTGDVTVRVALLDTCRVRLTHDALRQVRQSTNVLSFLLFFFVV